MWKEPEGNGKGRLFSLTLFTSRWEICPGQSTFQPSRVSGLCVNLQFLGLPPEERQEEEGGGVISGPQEGWHQLIRSVVFLYQVLLVLGTHELLQEAKQKPSSALCTNHGCFGRFLFSLILHPLSTARGKEQGSRATSSGPVFRTSFLGVSFHAQGTV